MRYTDKDYGYVEFRPLMLPDRYELLDKYEGLTDGASKYKIAATLINCSAPYFVSCKVGKKSVDWEALMTDTAHQSFATSACSWFITNALGGGEKK